MKRQLTRQARILFVEVEREHRISGLRKEVVAAFTKSPSGKTSTSGSVGFLTKKRGPSRRTVQTSPFEKR